MKDDKNEAWLDGESILIALLLQKEKAGYSYQEIEDRSGVEKSTVQNLLNTHKNPRLKNVAAVARSLGYRMTIRRI